MVARTIAVESARRDKGHLAFHDGDLLRLPVKRKRRESHVQQGGKTRFRRLARQPRAIPCGESKYTLRVKGTAVMQAMNG